MPAASGFRCFPQLNGVNEPAMMRDRSPVTRARVRQYFSGDTLQNKVVRALAEDDLLPTKEILESFEFFQRVRKEARAPHVADLCCGHGLVGMLFALFERCVQRVELIDRKIPPSHAGVLKCVSQVGPWVADKVRFRAARLARAAELLEPKTTVVSCHACGVLTDACIDAAVAVEGTVAVMPCCYPRPSADTPPALTQHLGHDTAFDIHRTYRLHHAGYHVRWTSIPEAITPMNRVLVGRKA